MIKRLVSALVSAALLGGFFAPASAQTFFPGTLNNAISGAAAKTGNYTVTATRDCGQTILLGGSAFYTLTVGAPAGYDANCMFMVQLANGEARAKALSISGVTAPCVNGMLYQGQAVIVSNQNGAWAVQCQTRWKLTAALTLNVDPAGSDSNDGLATGAGGALATIQKAWDTAADGFDLAGQQLTILSAAGKTYTAASVLSTGKAMIGATGMAAVTIDGAGSTATVTGGGNAYAFQGGSVALDGGPSVQFTMKGWTITSSGGGGGAVTAAAGASIALDTGMIFGTVTREHINASTHSLIMVNKAYSITGNAQVHINAQSGSAIYGPISLAVTVGGGLSFSTAFAQSSYDALIAYDSGVTFSSNVATGKRFIGQYGGIINRAVTALTFFPGNAAGTVTSGASYGGAMQVTGTIDSDNAAAGDVGEFMSSNCPGNGYTSSVTINIANPAVITWTSHGFTTACPVVFTNGAGTLPAHIVAGTTYWVGPTSVAANTFSVGSTVQNAIAGTYISTLGDTQTPPNTGTAGAPLTTATAVSVTGIVLTAGDWDVWAYATYTGGATTTVNYAESSISRFNNNIDTANGTFSTCIGAAAAIFNYAGLDGMTCLSGPYRVTVANGATVNSYLGVKAGFGTSTMNAAGFLQARRRR